MALLNWTVVVPKNVEANASDATYRWHGRDQSRPVTGRRFHNYNDSMAADSGFRPVEPVQIAPVHVVLRRSHPCDNRSAAHFV
jgi:hypothetical protein